MEKLIREYKEGRSQLRLLIKEIDLKMAATAAQEDHDPDEIMSLKSDRSLINGMIRDMTESISLMRSTHYRLRGSIQDQKEQLMDPEMINALNVPSYKWDPDTEATLRTEILDKYWTMIQTRLELLTNKQRSTLDRWITKGQSISDISREDGVSRQAVWIRLFGDRTNKGALKILKEGK